MTSVKAAATCGPRSWSTLNGELAALRSRSIGFVFQQFFLAEHSTALENIADGLLYAGVGVRERRARAVRRRASEPVHGTRQAPRLGPQQRASAQGSGGSRCAGAHGPGGRARAGAADDSAQPMTAMMMALLRLMDDTAADLPVALRDLLAMDVPARGRARR